MTEISVSPEDYAASFPDCQPGEKVTGTYSGTVKTAGPEGATIETDTITKDEGTEEEPGTEAETPAPKRSPAVMAALGKGMAGGEGGGY